MLFSSRRSSHVYHYLSIDALLAEWYYPSDINCHIDMIEICGGESRTSQLFVRRFHRKGGRAGLNIDLSAALT